MTTIQGMPNLGPGLRLHLNENTAGCSPRGARRHPRRLDAATWRRYPDYEGAVRDTAAYLGVDPDWVVLTNGLDEGLLLTAIAYLVPRAPEALVALGAPPMAAQRPAGADPDAAHLRAVRHQRQGAWARAPWRSRCGADFAFPARRGARGGVGRTRGSSTSTRRTTRAGGRCSEAAIRRVVERADHAVVLLDEAYHDFHGVHFLHLAREYPNVLIGRTFSKAHGLAGMRVGVLVAPPRAARRRSAS